MLRYKTQPCTLLGAFNFLMSFINYFSHLPELMSRWIRRDATQDWYDPPEEQCKSFESLKASLVKPPVLGLPIANGALMIETDSSAYQLGVKLLQQQHDSAPKIWAMIRY